MNPETKTPVPAWYWVVAVVALLWNLMGSAAFLTEIFAQDAMMESWSAEQKEWAHSIPGWIYVIYAVAVTTGVVGCIGLLMRKAWTMPLFVCSAVTVIVQMVYTMLIAGGLKVMGPSSAVMPALVTIIACALLWFSWFAKGKSWLV